MKEKLIKITATALLIASTSANAGWSISTIGTLEGLRSTASGINNFGQIVGGYVAADGTSRTFITGPDGIGITDIGTLGGSYSVATAINDSGQVAGYSQLSNPLKIHAFVTGPNGIGMTDLGAFNKLNCDYYECAEGREYSMATSINKSGQVAGRDGAEYPDVIMDGFITKPDGVSIVNLTTIYSHYLPATGGYRFASANGINDSGQVTGIVDYPIPGLPGTDSYIFITGANGIGVTFIDGLGSNYKEVNSINNSGQIAGSYYPSEPGEAHSFITGINGIGIIDLGTLGGLFSRALDINDSGQVIGMSFNSAGAYHPYFFNDGEMIDLSILPEVLDTGWTDLRVSAINNSGEIVGYGKFGGITQAFLLSPLPVPEPSTYALLLAGLGLLGFMGRESKQKKETRIQ